MNNKLTFTGGEPNMNEDDFLRIQQANRLALHGISKAFSNDPFIVSGCETTPNGSNIDVAAGYIFFGDELVQVDAQIDVDDTEGNGFYRYEIETTFEAGGDKTYLDSTPRQTWEKKRGIAVSVVSISGGDLDVKDGPRFTDLVQAIIDVNNGGVLTTPPINIGDWNMVTTPSVAIAHGIADWTKIIGVKVIIIADTDNAAYPLAQDLLVAHDPSSPGSAAVSGAYAVNATNVVLSRLTTGWYDQGGWDNTPYNRGHIIIEYIL